MNIAIADLDINNSLDQDAMNLLLGGGGWHSHGSRTTYSNYRKRVGAWKRFGPISKRKINQWRTKTTVTRQHKRTYQIRVGFSF